MYCVTTTWDFVILSEDSVKVMNFPCYWKGNVQISADEDKVTAPSWTAIKTGTPCYNSGLEIF
jgi:hypothetical protein